MVWVGQGDSFSVPLSHQFLHIPNQLISKL
jgi:hypothetical protein